MIYVFDESIPINILPDNPLRYDLRLTKGLVYRLEITFPPGSFGLAGIRIFDGGHQLWPSTGDKWFRGDNVKVDFDELYLKEEAPFLFKIEAYNRDVQWEHTIFIRIGIVSKKVFLARFMPTVSYELYKDMLTEIKDEQEQEKREQLERIYATRFFGGAY